MTPKRNDQSEGLERNGRQDETSVMAHTLRAAADIAQAPSDTKTEKKEDEKISLFWRVFGGTILSIVALVAVTIFNNLNSNIVELRTELNRANETRATAVAELKSEMIRKEEFSTRMTSNWDRVQVLQTQNVALNTSITSLKSENEGLKDRLTKLSSELDAMKKDNSLINDSVKKDSSAIENMKEKLGILSLDLKGTREEFQKMRTDLERNQAADNERKERRDAQYKQVDDAMRELQRGLQDSREKLARFEGQYAPPQPVGTQPKKGNVNRPPVQPIVGPPKPDWPETAPSPTDPKTPSKNPPDKENK